MEIHGKSIHDIAGYDKETLKDKFGALYNAFQFGAPHMQEWTRSRPYDHVTSQRRKHPRDHRFPNERNSTGSDVRSTKRDYRTAAS